MKTSQTFASFLGLSLFLSSLAWAGEKKDIAQPFARLTVKFNGCASCAGCRSAMRQVAQTKSARHARIQIGDDRSLSATYPKATNIPMRELPAALGKSGLHQFEVAEVTLETKGTVTEKDGQFFLILPETGQCLLLSGLANAEEVTGQELALRGKVRNWQSPEEQLVLDVQSAQSIASAASERK